MEVFKGKISNIRQQVLSHTSGNTSISTNAFTGNVSGSGSVQTHQEHYTDFELDGKVFRCDGNYMFKEGDSVALGAYDNGQGFWQVRILKNATRNFYFSQLRKRMPIGGFIRGLFGGFFGSGIVFWLILWILAKIVGFSKAVKESHLPPFAYLAVVAFLAVFIAIKSYKNISDERKTTLYFERQVKDYAG